MNTLVLINSAAFQFALSTYQLTDPHALETSILSKFNEEGFDPKDFAVWKSDVSEYRGKLRQKNTQRAPSEGPRPLPQPVQIPTKPKTE